MWHLQVFSWTCWPSPDKCLNHAVPLRWGEIKISVEAFWKCVNRAKRLSITFRSDGKREFVPHDQVSPLLVVYYCSLFLGIISNQGPNINLVVSRNFLSIRILLSCFYLLIFYFEKFLTWIWCLLNSLMSLVVPFPGLGIDFRGGTYPWSTGTSNLVDVTTQFALLCQRLAIELCLENLWNLTNMASKAMKKKESKERVASAARTIPEWVKLNFIHIHNKEIRAQTGLLVDCRQLAAMKEIRWCPFYVDEKRLFPNW